MDPSEVDTRRPARSHNIPLYLVIGSQKSGTTSLYELIQQHGLAVKGRSRESHFFDWRWNVVEKLDAAKQYQSYLQFYPQDSLRKHASLFSGESTPSYLLHR